MKQVYSLTETFHKLKGIYNLPLYAPEEQNIIKTTKDIPSAHLYLQSHVTNPFKTMVAQENDETSFVEISYSGVKPPLHFL